MQLSITRLFYYYCVALLMPLHFFIIPLFRLPCSVPSSIKSPRFALSIPVHLLSLILPHSISNPIHVWFNPQKIQSIMQLSLFATLQWCFTLKTYELCRLMTDYRTFREDFQKLVDFVHWYNEFKWLSDFGNVGSRFLAPVPCRLGKVEEPAASHSRPNETHSATFSVHEDRLG